MTTSHISETEVEIKAIRSSGPGGQHVNKASTAIQLRFDSQNSHLPDDVKKRILVFSDARIARDGVITITARRFRSQDANKLDALARLNDLIQKVAYQQKRRRATRPTRSSVEKRLTTKARHGKKKQLRGRVDPEE